VAYDVAAVRTESATADCMSTAATARVRPSTFGHRCE